MTLYIEHFKKLNLEFELWTSREYFRDQKLTRTKQKLHWKKKWLKNDLLTKSELFFQKKMQHNIIKKPTIS